MGACGLTLPVACCRSSTVGATARFLAAPILLAAALCPVRAAYAVDCTAATSAATLAAAIDAVNAGICDTINLTGNVTLVSQNLPVIDRIGAVVTIQGDGGTRTLSGSDDSRLIAVLNGNVTVQNLVIQDGLAKGGDGGEDNAMGGGGGGSLGAGGGIFVGAGASVTVRNVAFAGNTAQGGDGGNATRTTLNGGGGGGGGGLNGGNGGSSTGGTGTQTQGGKGGGGGFGAFFP